MTTTISCCFVFGKFTCFSSMGISRASISEKIGTADITNCIEKGNSEELIILFHKAYPYRNPID